MDRIRELLKSIGGFLLGIILLAAFFILIDLFLYGTAWLSTKVLPILNLIVAGSFVILLLVGFPLSFFRKCRGMCAGAFLYWSYICGLSLWLFSLLVTLSLWGVTAVIIGLIFAGVGILPVALLACIFKGEWSIFFQLLVQLALVIGCGGFADFLAQKAELEDFEEPSGGGEHSRQLIKPWLRWIFVLPAAILAWIGIQVGIVIVSGMVDLVWTGKLGGLNDTYLVQLLNSIASAWAFVVAGKKIAPSKRAATALCLTALFISGNLAAVFFVQESGGGAWEVQWSLICFVVSALTLVVATYEIWKAEKRAKEAIGQIRPCEILIPPPGNPEN